MKKGDKIRGIVGTIIFHLLLLVVLIFFGLTTPLPLPGEEGVEVNLGFTDEGMGIIQQSEAPKTSPPLPPVNTKEEVIEDVVEEVVKNDPIIEEVEEEKIITQDSDETPKITKPIEEIKEDIPEKEILEKPKEKAKVKVKEAVKADPVEKPKVVEKVPEKPKVDPRALYTGKSKSTDNGSNEGETGKPGDQGSKFGKKDIIVHDGKGGEGNGVSFDLGGRGAKHLPKPTYDSPDQGKVVVTIYVNKQGQVTKAYAGAKGTTIADNQLRKLAKEAALRAVFNPDPNAPETQKGAITYNFIRLQ